MQHFAPHQCLRQLALIELPDKRYQDLPLDHEALLGLIREARASEVSHCEVLSEVKEAAVQRLIEYCRDSARAYANARIVNPKDRSDKDAGGRLKLVFSDEAVEAALRFTVDIRSGDGG